MDDQAHTTASSCCGCGGGSKRTTLVEAATAAKDPVCGMTVDPAASKHSFSHEGTTYQFCCGGCLAKFEADPGKYVATRETSSELDIATRQTVV